MAIFNPEVKETQDPFYLNLSHPISDQKNYGTGLSEGLKGAAALGTDVVKVAHTLTEQTLSDKIHTDIDVAREDEKAKLDATLYNVSGGKAGTKGDAVADATLLSGGTGSVPPTGLQNLDQTLDGVAGAGPGPRGNGRLSRTDYAARLDTLAKDIRSQYPGWTDYIDQKFKSITGMDPANAVIAGRIADINSWITNKKTEGDKLDDILRNKHLGEETAPGYMAMRKAGALSDEALTQILSGYDRNATILKHAEEQWKMTAGTAADRSVKAENAAGIVAQQAVTDQMSLIMAPFGNDPNKARESLANADPKQLDSFIRNLNDRKDQIKLMVRNKLASMIDERNPDRNALSDMKEGAFEKILNDKLAVYDAWSTSLQKRDTISAGLWRTANEAATDKLTYDVYQTDVGNKLQMQKILRTHAGEAATATFIENELSTAEGFPKQWQQLREDIKLRRATGTPHPETGVTTTLKDDVAEGYRLVNKDTTLSPEGKRKVIANLNEDMFKQIEGIIDPRTPKFVKENYVRSTFSPENRGMLAKMELDGVGPQGITKGRYSVYNRLYSPDMAQAIFLMGPQYYNLFKESAKSGIQNELLQPEVARLNKLQLDPDIRITYDNENQRFGVNYGKGINVNEKQLDGPFLQRTQQRLGQDATVTETNKFINRLNSSLYTYKNIAGKDEKDVNAFLIGTLRDLGFDPSISKPDGIDRKMIDAIEASSKAQQERKKELEKAYKRK